MPDPATLLLSVVAVAGIVAVLGVDRTTSAASTAGSGAKRVATSSWTAGLAGIGIGGEIAYQLLQAISMEPFAFTTAIAGIMGALGIEGFLGDITGVQFLLIGFSIFVGVYMLDRRVR